MVSPVVPEIRATSDLGNISPEGVSNLSIPGLSVPIRSPSALTSIMTPT